MSEEDKIYERERAERIEALRKLISSGVPQSEINKALTDAIEQGYLDINKAHERIRIRKKELESLSGAIITISDALISFETQQRKRDKTIKVFLIAAILLVLGSFGATIAVLIGGKEALQMLSALSSFLKPVMTII